MSIFTDMRSLYQKYGLFDEPMDKEKLQFRLQLLNEEVGELGAAVSTSDSEEVVDALIDIIVIAAGTLELLKVDGDLAWAEIYLANSTKKRGIKDTRPNSKGFDLIKPPGWNPPSHTKNHGVLDELFK